MKVEIAAKMPSPVCVKRIGIRFTLTFDGSAPPPEDACDLAQRFFLDLLQRYTFSKADPQLGRMRTYLLTALKRFMAKVHSRECALNRGGGQPLISIDEQDAEGRNLDEPTEKLSPELLFERRWEGALFERAFTRLRQHFTRMGKSETFERLKEYLAKSENDESYAKVATALEMSEGAAGVAVFRMRKRFRGLLEEEICDTLTSKDECDDEMRHLHAMFGSP